MLYEYLLENFGENNPILVSEIQIEGLTDNTLRQQIKKLTDSGKLKRFDTGVYYIPKDFGFKSGCAAISSTRVIEKKYLMDSDKIYGYLSGVNFANQIGLTTQVPFCYEVVSNRASRDYRELTVGKTRVILRKPRTLINEENYRALQFLDLMREVDLISELEGEGLTERLLCYLKASKMIFKDLDPFLPLYPDKVYRNLYETRLLNGISA